MNVIQTGSELALLCVAVHYQERIKINVNKCVLSWLPSVEKIYVSSTVTSLIFLYTQRVKLCVTLQFTTAYCECKR